MKKQALKLINWYKTEVSPNKEFKCRHTPSCSDYALTAYQRFNFAKATFLTTKRILKCNPLFKPRFDPVPEKKIRKRKNKQIIHQEKETVSK